MSKREEEETPKCEINEITKAETETDKISIGIRDEKKESIKTETTQESDSKLKLKKFKDKLRIIERELFSENIEFYFPSNTNYNLYFT